MAKHYHTQRGIGGCYVIHAHGMGIHIFPSNVDKQEAEEMAELLDMAYELGLIRGANGHPHAPVPATPTRSEA